MTILTPILICLAVAAILGALWLFAPAAALQATISVGVIAALGISGGGSGGRLPPPSPPPKNRPPMMKN